MSTLAQDIQERAKKLRGDDTESLLKKLNKQFKAYSDEFLDIERARERREKTLFKRMNSGVSMFGGVSDIQKFDTPISRKKTTDKIITTDKEVKTSVIDLKQQISSDNKQMMDITSQGFKAVARFFIFNKIVGGIYDYFKDLVRTDADNTTKIVHAITNVERAVRGEDSEDLKYKSKLDTILGKVRSGNFTFLDLFPDIKDSFLEVKSIYKDNDDLVENVKENVKEKTSVMTGAFAGMFSKIKESLFGVEKTVKDVGEKKAFGFKELMNRGVKDKDLEKLSKTKGDVFDKAAGFLDKLSKKAGDKTFAAAELAFVDTTNSIIAGRIVKPVSTFKTSAKIFGTAMSLLINRPLKQTLPFMLQFGGVWGVGLALFMKSFRIFTFDLFSIFKRKKQAKGFFQTMKNIFHRKKGIFGDFLKRRIERQSKGIVGKIAGAVGGLFKKLMGSRVGGLLGLVGGMFGRLFAGIGAILTSAFSATRLLGIVGAAVGGWKIGTWLYEKFRPEISDFVWNTAQAIIHSVQWVKSRWNDWVIEPINNMITSVISSVRRTVKNAKDFINNPFGFFGEDTNTQEVTDVGGRIVAVIEPKPLFDNKKSEQLQEEMVDVLKDVKTAIENNYQSTSLLNLPSKTVEDALTWQIGVAND